MPRSQTTEEEKKQIEEWLAKGNKITICPPNTRTEDITYVHGWGKKKKKSAKKD
jgi:hypothetical protein